MLSFTLMVGGGDDAHRCIDEYVEELKETVEDLLLQFAYRGEDSRGRYLFTGGLSALEYAFIALGWEDPHYMEL